MFAIVISKPMPNDSKFNLELSSLAEVLKSNESMQNCKVRIDVPAIVYFII